MAVVLGAALIATAWVGPLSAQGGRAETFFSAPVPAVEKDAVVVRFFNVGRGPVRVTVDLRDAVDGSPIGMSQDPVLVDRGHGGVSFRDVSETLGSGIVAVVQVEGPSVVLMSLEVVGKQIFTDGFESGNTGR